MLSLDKYNSDLGVAHMLVGEAGSGKTSLGMTLYPGTYCLVGDPNFKSGIDWLKRTNRMSNVVGFDLLNIDDAGKVVPINLRYQRALDCINAAIKDPTVKAILVESVTFFSDVIKAKITGALTEDKIRLANYEHWDQFRLIWKTFVNQLRTTGKKIIFTAHIEKEKDESDGMFKYGIMVDGKTKTFFPILFSDVWHCEVVEDGVGANTKHIWKVRMLPNQRQAFLKNTFGFPALLPADEVVQKVQATLPK